MRYIEAMGFPNDAPPAYNGAPNCQDPNAIGGSSSASVNAPPNSMASSSSSSAAQNGGRSQSPSFHPITYSASCPSFTALYELPADDLMGDFSNGGKPSGHNNYGSNSGSFVGPPANSFASELDQSPPTSGPAPLATYEELLEFQQQHHRASLRQFPHHHQPHMHDHLAVLRQSRRQLHASASFTSLSSMETEYRRQSGNCMSALTCTCPISLWILCVPQQVNGRSAPTDGSCSRTRDTSHVSASVSSAFVCVGQSDVHLSVHARSRRNRRHASSQ